MNTDILRKPSAILPIAMSMTALAIVLIHIITVGTTPAQDEGASAHMFQLLIAGQVPVVAFFAVRWLPRLPAQGLYVIATQIGAALLALLPVYWLGL